ncbi:MAG TPA: acyl-CoA dehydrogenase, partial [Gammaproteobacteria bacterium]|nr:acyl-CoA dehydrogenase [Gammaproteobacteria bacterium]
MYGLIFALVVIASLWALAYYAAPLWAWTLTVAVAIGAEGMLCHSQSVPAWIIFIVLAVILNLRPLRRMLITDHLLSWFRKVLPPISETERVAI